MNDLISSNKRRTVALIFGFVLIVVLVGAAVGSLVGNGTTGTILAVILSGIFAFISYWKSDALALRVVVPYRPIPPNTYVFTT